MSESKILTKELIQGMHIAKLQINTAISELQSASSLNDAISVIDKLLEDNEERVLNFNEIIILDTLMALPLVSSGSRDLEEMVGNYFNDNRELINEILPTREENAQVSFLSCFKDCFGKKAYPNEGDTAAHNPMLGQHKHLDDNDDAGGGVY